MPSNQRHQFEKEAHAGIKQFVAENPEYSIDADQPNYRGGTNYVLRGHLGKEQVIFKYFVRTYRWSQAYFCLQHFAPTGMVPKVLTIIPHQLIVMTRLAEYEIGDEAPDMAERSQISRQIGQALATWLQVPLPQAADMAKYAAQSEFEAFSWRLDMGHILRDTLTICQRIQQLVPAYQVSLYRESLALLEAQIDHIDQQPRTLFHEDISNMSLDKTKFVGFFDLEMVRIGTEAHQLGVAIHLCHPHYWDFDWLHWPSFIESYQAAADRTLTDEDHRSILAMCHFYHHLRISKWGEWDETQPNAITTAALQANEHLSSMWWACQALKEFVDMERWFPSLEGG